MSNKTNWELKQRIFPETKGEYRLIQKIGNKQIKEDDSNNFQTNIHKY